MLSLISRVPDSWIAPELGLLLEDTRRYPILAARFLQLMQIPESKEH